MDRLALLGALSLVACTATRAGGGDVTPGGGASATSASPAGAASAPPASSTGAAGAPPASPTGAGSVPPVGGGNAMPPSGTGSGTTVPARPGYGATQMQTLRNKIQAEIDAKHYTTDKWSIGDATAATDVSFITIPSLRLSLSASCRQASGKLACGALDGLLAVPGKDVHVGNGTPASYYCKPAGGTPSAGTGPNGGGGSAGFCTFHDGSMIDSWAFVYTPNIVFGPNPASR